MGGLAMFFYRLCMAVFPCMPHPGDKFAIHHGGDEQQASKREAAELHADLLSSNPTASQLGTPTPYPLLGLEDSDADLTSECDTPGEGMIPLAAYLEVQRELEKQREVARVFREAWQKLQDDVSKMSEPSPTPSPMPQRPQVGLSPLSASPILSSHALRMSLRSASAESTERYDTASNMSLTPCNDNPLQSTPEGMAVLSPLSPVEQAEEPAADGSANEAVSTTPSADNAVIYAAAPAGARTPLMEVASGANQGSLSTKWSQMEQQVAASNSTTPPPSLFLPQPNDENASPNTSGVPNTVSKYQENKTVCVHSTPFPVRVDRALQVEREKSRRAQQ